jgi:hypothetical protein
MSQWLSEENLRKSMKIFEGTVTKSMKESRHNFTWAARDENDPVEKMKFPKSKAKTSGSCQWQAFN